MGKHSKERPQAISLDLHTLQNDIDTLCAQLLKTSGERTENFDEQRQELRKRYDAVLALDQWTEQDVDDDGEIVPDEYVRPELLKVLVEFFSVLERPLNNSTRKRLEVARTTLVTLCEEGDKYDAALDKQFLPYGSPDPDHRVVKTADLRAGRITTETMNWPMTGWTCEVCGRDDSLESFRAWLQYFASYNGVMDQLTIINTKTGDPSCTAEGTDGFAPEVLGARQWLRRLNRQGVKADFKLPSRLNSLTEIQQAFLELAEALSNCSTGSQATNRGRRGRGVTTSENRTPKEQEALDEQCHRARNAFRAKCHESKKRPFKVNFGNWVLDSEFDIGTLNGTEAWSRADAYEKRLKRRR